MLLLHQSKSYTCESTLPLPDLPPTNEYHHSTASLTKLDSLPHSRASLSSLCSLSKSSSSSSCDYSTDSSFNSINTFVENPIVLKSSFDQINKKIVEVKPLKKAKKKFKKPRVVTHELALFKVRRSSENSQLYFLNSANTASDDEYSFDTLNSACDEYGNSIQLTQSLYEPAYLKRPTRNNKKTKLKTLVKHKDIFSIVNPHLTGLKGCCLSKNALTKNSNSIHIKYNLYKKLSSLFANAYVPHISRPKHVYSPKRIDKIRSLDKEKVSRNKNINTLVNRQLEHDEKNANRPIVDPPVVINYSLGDHNERVHSELNEAYDAMYLEFLISIQHREITPEDYEYLSRLDELVKKKTLNESILNNLKTEKITCELLEVIEREEEKCGICLDQYALDQMRRHLPCGHKFHADCIDHWLKKQSTNCPLDNMPVGTVSIDQTAVTQRSESFNFNQFVLDNEQSDQDLIAICDIADLLGEMIVQVEAEHGLNAELENILSHIIAKIEG